jgi:hypothetical protein
MNEFTIEKNDFLKMNIQGYYNTHYVGFRKPGNPDFLNVLKNTFKNKSDSILKWAVSELRNILVEDLDSLARVISDPLAICVVPRAKVNYAQNQLLFKSTVKSVIKEINVQWSGRETLRKAIIDGTDYIIRCKNTRTTHLPLNTPNYNNDGDWPYPGITKTTCKISSRIKDKNIILIDDIYTKSINIDEDAIQALFDNGAKSVVFYAVAKTVDRRHLKNGLYRLQALETVEDIPF